MNSSLVDKVIYSPNNSGKRTHAIDRITPHCVVGQCSIEVVGDLFSRAERKASSNYCIGADGRIGLFVDEDKRSWCSSSNANDQRAVTIECASDKTSPYAFNNTVWNKLIELCTDICKRNGKTKLLWIADKTKAFNYEPCDNEMLITIHQWFANTDCPGDWLIKRLSELATAVTNNLQTTEQKQEEKQKLYRVQVGAYRIKANAENKAKELREKGFETYIVYY